MNILVVDDEKEIADVIELYLKNDQYNVLKFYTGQEALDCIASTKIDLAILDIMLPDVDGFQILKQIREKYTFPVIMLTAKTEYMDKITGLTLGADDYIIKPFNMDVLRLRIRSLLESRAHHITSPLSNFAAHTALYAPYFTSSGAICPQRICHFKQKICIKLQLYRYK